MLHDTAWIRDNSEWKQILSRYNRLLYTGHRRRCINSKKCQYDEMAKQPPEERLSRFDSSYWLSVMAFIVFVYAPLSLLVAYTWRTLAAPTAPARALASIKLVVSIHLTSRAVTSLHVLHFFSRTRRAKHPSHEAVFHKRGTACAHTHPLRILVHRNFHHGGITSVIVLIGIKYYNFKTISRFLQTSTLSIQTKKKARDCKDIEKLGGSVEILHNN